jgi:CRP-like cAMP-binding protein
MAGEFTMAKTLAFLRKGAWFGKMPQELQRSIVDSGKVRTFDVDEILSVEDQPGRGLFAILQGQALLTRRVGIDREVLVHIAGPGSWFGEIPVLSNNVPVVTVTARTRVHALHLTTAKFRQLGEQSPELYRYLAEFSALRSAIAIRQFADSLAMSPGDFLRIRLSDLVMMWRNDGIDDEVVELAISQTDVSRMIGASRQTVNRCLSNLQAEGLIEVSFHSIRILDPDGLRRGEPTIGLNWNR